MKILWMVFLAGLLLCSPLFICADTITEDFDGVTAVSTVHIAKYGYSTSTDWDSASSEATNVGGGGTMNYTNLYSSDDTRFYYYSGVSDYNHSYKFEFNVSRICSDNSIDLNDVTNIRFAVEGYTHGGSGSFCMAVYNDNTATWISSDNADCNGTWLHNSSGDSELIVDISSNIDDYLIDTRNGYMKFSIMNTGVGYVGYVDYVYVTLTYNSLGTPSFTAPTSGATVSSSTPTVSWGAVSGATGYNLQIGNADFSVLEVNEANVTTNSKSCTLTNGIKYARVRACDGTNYSSYSDTLVFTVSAVLGGGGSPSGGGYFADRDGDSVFDYLDECPDVSGPPSNDGCPVDSLPYDGPRENLLIRPILKIYGFPIPFWSLIVLLAGVGYLKKRPELYILSGCITVALILFGSKLAVMFV